MFASQNVITSYALGASVQGCSYGGASGAAAGQQELKGRQKGERERERERGFILSTNFKLCSFFCVIPRRLNFICRRFGTLSSIFIGGAYTTYEDGITQKKEYSIQNMAEV